MKIIILGTSYPMRGGIAHYVALLYKALRQRGHEVQIISFKRQYPSIFFPGKTQQDSSKEVEPIPSKPLLDSIGPLSWIRTFLEIRRQQPDLIIFKYWLPFFAPAYASIAFLTRLFTRTRVLYICDNIVPHERKLGDTLLNRLGLAFVDYFIVQSSIVRSDLLRFRPQANFKEVPHPVYEIFKQNYTAEAARQKLGIGLDEHVLLFFGYVRAYKGLSLLVEALPIIREQMPIKLLVAGEFYDDKTKYLRQIEQLGLQNSVQIFDDYIPNEEVGLYFAAANVVVLPYVSATQSGIVQIAYNYNKPVITTDVGGLPEAVAQDVTGLVVPAQDVQALAQAILRFFKEKKEETYTENIKEQKKQFSWERLAVAIEEFLTPALVANE
ncbi:MAG: glycosyltransferase [candidate division KSB1 bacterium]|nr:glycosyltransferase [candidate division KSB1 bacterium]